VNLTSQLICKPCENGFDIYDWLFIAFHVICCLLLHYQAIWRLAVTRSAIIVAEYASATFEVLGGFLITIISFPPFGSFKLTACYNSRVIYDDINQYWYNSFPDGFYILIPPSLFFSDPFKVVRSNRCFYEVIYPRFSLPLAGLCMSLILTILLRPLLLLSLNKGDKLHDNLPYLYKPLSQTLVAYPMYTMVLTIASGAIYWGHAYLLLGFALFSISLYAAYASNQNYIRLITSSDRLIHIPCIICHFLLLALSAWSYTSRNLNANTYVVFPLILVPLVFLLLTDRISCAKTTRIEADPELKEQTVTRRATTAPNDGGQEGSLRLNGFMIDQSPQRNSSSNS